MAALIPPSIVVSLLMLSAFGVTLAGNVRAQGEHLASAGQEDEEPAKLVTTFSDEPIPMQLDSVPERPTPIVEFGNPFLGKGPIDPGFKTWTGAVWQPALIIFGTYRSAFQSFDNGSTTSTEWVNRLDLFANLQLSGTERLLVGIRPLDKGGDFTGYYSEPDDARLDGWESEVNGRLTHLFFEGDFGEVFPGLDPADRAELDLGFSVGRQPLFYQEGLLIDDRMDAIGITKNSILASGLSHLQMTALYAWDEVNRGDNVEDSSADLFGFFVEAETLQTTFNLDAVYVNDSDTGVSDNDGLFFGGSAVQRIGKINTSFRALASIPSGDASSAVGEGQLLMTELSYTPAHSEDNLYCNGFVALDEFTSAARNPESGGPLGRTGVLFAAVGIGRYGAPLSNDAQNAVGAALGYQHFFDEKRRQVIVEAGFRADTDNSGANAISIASQLQMAVGQHSIFSVSGFVTGQENDDAAIGARVEWLIKF